MPGGVRVHSNCSSVPSNRITEMPAQHWRAFSRPDTNFRLPENNPPYLSLSTAALVCVRASCMTRTFTEMLRWTNIHIRGDVRAGVGIARLLRGREGGANGPRGGSRTSRCVSDRGGEKRERCCRAVETHPRRRWVWPAMLECSSQRVLAAKRLFPRGVPPKMKKMGVVLGCSTEVCRRRVFFCPFGPSFSARRRREFSQ